MAATAPTMIVTGLSGTLWGEVGFTVAVSAAYAVKSIHCRIGNQDLWAEGAFDDAATVTFTLFTENYTDGSNTMVVRAADINNNLVEQSIPIVIDNGFTMAPIETPPLLTALTAVTVDYDYGAWSAEPKKVARGKAAPEPGILDIKGRRIDITTAPTGCNLYTFIYWLPQDSNEWSYRVYRATSPGGPWTRIYDGPPHYYIDETGEYYCIDTSPQLTPDITYYYKVSSYNEAGEGPASEIHRVQPLGKLSVSLVSPAHQATGVSLTPTLSWSLDGAAGHEWTYAEFEVIGVTDENYSWQSHTYDATSVSYAGTPLVAGRTYEWDVTYALAYRDLEGTGNYLAIAVAPSGSNNGAFTFTTAAE